MLPGGGFVVLDTVVTPELAAEGLARDLVRAVQQARRDAGLDVTDRIVLTVGGTDAVRQATAVHTRLIGGETLATTVEIDERGTSAGTEVALGDGERAIVSVRKA